MSKVPCTSSRSEITPSPSNAHSGGLPWEEDWDILEEGEPEGDEKDDPTEEEPEGKQSAALQKEIARLREANRKLKEREAAAAAEAKKQAEAEAAKRGEYQKLYEALKADHEKATGELTAYQKREQERLERLETANAAALKQIPDAFRDLIPDGLDPEAKAAQIERIRQKVLKEGPDGGVISKPPKNTKTKPPAACVESARRHGKDPEAWFPVWLKTREGREWQSKQ